MKRIISLVLILILSLGVLTACPKPSTTSEYPLDQAAEYVRGLYIDYYQTKSDFTVISSLSFSNAKYTVEWSVDNEAIKLVPSEDGLEVTVDVPELGAEAIEYTLTGTVIAPDEFTKDITFDLVVPASSTPVNKVPVVVTNPEVGVAYKFGMYQETKAANYYLKGGMSGYYLATTDADDYSSALDFYLEATNGGYYMYCMENGVKTYINFVVSGTHVNGSYDATPSTVFTFNSKGIFSTTVNGEEYGFGTYGNYVTLGPNKTSYDTNFFGYFYTLGVAQGGSQGGNQGGNNQGATDGVIKTGEAYKFYLEQRSLSKTLYFTGELQAASKGNYLATSESSADAVEIFFEAANGGYNIYFMKDGVKTYLDVYPYLDGSNLKCQFAISTEAPDVVWTYDTTYNVIKVKVTYEDKEKEFYAGNYNSNTPIRLSDTYYIEQLVTTETQHAARLEDANGNTVTAPSGGNTGNQGGNQGATDANVVTTPETGVAYKFGLYHGNESQNVYLNGQNYNSYNWYFAYTPVVAEAVDVYLETVEGVAGGYRLYFMNGDAKTYVRMYQDSREGHETEGTLEFTTTVPTEYFTFNTEYNTLVWTNANGEQNYMGSSGTYKSISASHFSYITNDTSYISHLYKAGENTGNQGGNTGSDNTGSDNTTTPPADDNTTTNPTIPENYVKVTSAAEFTSGTYVLVVNGVYGLGHVDGTWITRSDDLSDSWTLTVSESTVTMKDKNGVFVAPKSGNGANNGIVTGTEYSWTWTFADGTFKFTGTGDDTNVLCYNAADNGLKFRSYKASTATNTTTYVSSFTVYKLVEN